MTFFLCIYPSCLKSQMRTKWGCAFSMCEISVIRDPCVIQVIHECFLRSLIWADVGRRFRPTGLYVNSFWSRSTFLVGWELCSIHIFYIVYMYLSQTFYAMVHDFYEIHTQICGFPRLFHICNRLFTHVPPLCNLRYSSLTFHNWCTSH